MVTIYAAEVDGRLVGVALTLDEAKRLVESVAREEMSIAADAEWTTSEGYNLCGFSGEFSQADDAGRYEYSIPYGSVAWWELDVSRAAPE